MKRKEETIKNGAAQLVLWRDTNRRWHWRLLSMNYEIARSRPEGYSSKQGARQSLIGVRNAINKFRGE